MKVGLTGDDGAEAAQSFGDPGVSFRNAVQFGVKTGAAGGCETSEVETVLE
jgi:hypothetical protein